MKHILFTAIVYLSVTSAALPAAGATTIVSKASAQCVDIYKKLTTLGAVVEQWTCTGNSNQSFSLEPTDSGYYRIRNVNSSLCLNVDGRSMIEGGTVIQWTCGVTA